MAERTKFSEYSWVIPAVIILLILVWCGCSSSTSSVRLQQETGNFVDGEGNREPTDAGEASQQELKQQVPEKETRKEIKTKILKAYLDNNSSGFARLGMRSKRPGGRMYYPQIQHYFRTNENSYEAIIQKQSKKKKDKTIAPLAAPIQEKEFADDDDDTLIRTTS